MQLLLANSAATARALEQRAFAFVVQNQDATGGGWSRLWSDGTKFGIAFDNSVASAFTPVELGTTHDAQGNATGYANAIEAAPKTIAQDGTISGTWETIPDPL